MDTPSGPTLGQRILFAVAGISAITHGLRNLTTRDDLTTFLTIVLVCEVLAGAAALAVAAGVLGRRRPRDPTEH